jgi:hypothetical protein
MAPSKASSSRSPLDFITPKWSRFFFITVGFQALICLAFEIYIFVRFQSSTQDIPAAIDNPVLRKSLTSQVRTIPTFLTLFIFGFLYQLILSWDALRMKNTIQIIGICLSNLAFLIYTSLQVDQISQAVSILNTNGILKNDEASHNIWFTIRPFLIAIPVIISVVTVGISFLAWKLYREFAWDILKQIGADYRMKKRFLYYQIYIALLKFDFFFFLGFTVQFLVIVTGITDPEFGLTIAAIPITIAILLFAAVSTRRENKLGMIGVIVLYFGGLAYFFFKLVRIYQPGYRDNYEAVKKSMTAFAVITIILIILTILNSFICMSNFGAGLKAHLLKPSSRDPEKEDPNSFQMQDQKPQLPSRMTID